MKQKINVASLFSGIGGFEEGLKIGGLSSDIVFASEIDKFAQISYLANFKTENLHGDITTIGEDEIPDHELLLAGFPCQSFSIAGKRKGFEDARGTLFFDVARILNKKKPKFFLLENVKNLVSHDGGNTMNEILNILKDLDYTVDFTVINSTEAGVPQNRERTYICGIYKYKVEKYVKDLRSSKVNKLKQKLNKKGYSSFNFFNSLEFNANKRVLEDVLLCQTEEKYYLNSDEINSFLNSININFNRNRETKIIKILDLPKDIHNDLQRQRRVYSTKGISPTILARSDAPKVLISEDGRYRIRKITPVESFYIQGFDKVFVENIKNTGMSDTQMYKQSGNAVSPPVISAILKKLYKEYISYA